MKYPKAKPMLCNTQVVKNILAGRQTQDRRPLKKQPKYGVSPCAYSETGYAEAHEDGSCVCVPVKVRYRLGDIIYVREAWRIGAWDMDEGKICVDYKTGPRKEWVEIYPDDFDGTRFDELSIQCSDEAMASGLIPDDEGMYHWKPGESPCQWRPSIHMPKTLARIFLKVKRVWVERVQDISLADITAEGLRLSGEYMRPASVMTEKGIYETMAKPAFGDMWNKIYPGSWDRNDWVEAIEFELLGE